MSARRFPSDRRSAASTRRFVRDELDIAGVDSWPSEALASELASNALEHAGASFQVRVDLQAGVLVEVTDPRPDLAVDRSRGHGLRLVDRLAKRWGVRTSASTKTVWFEV